MGKWLLTLLLTVVVIGIALPRLQARSRLPGDVSINFKGRRYSFRSCRYCSFRCWRGCFFGCCNAYLGSALTARTRASCTRAAICAGSPLWRAIAPASTSRTAPRAPSRMSRGG